MAVKIWMMVMMSDEAEMDGDDDDRGAKVVMTATQRWRRYVTG